MLASVSSLAHFPFAGNQPPGGATGALGVFLWVLILFVFIFKVSELNIE